MLTSLLSLATFLFFNVVPKELFNVSYNAAVTAAANIVAVAPTVGLI